MSLSDNIKKLMKLKGWSQKRLADEIGTNQPSINRYAKGEFAPKPHMIEKLAACAGVPPAVFQYGDIDDPEYTEEDGISLMGEVRAGIWQSSETYNQAEPERVPVLPSPDYPGVSQFAVRVLGDSMDKRFKEGDILVCLDVASWGMEPQEGDLVIAQRLRDSDLREVTVKRLCREGEDIVLRPESTNPAHKPINLSESEPGIEVSIIGKVIGMYDQNL